MAMGDLNYKLNQHAAIFESNLNVFALSEAKSSVSESETETLVRDDLPCTSTSTLATKYNMMIISCSVNKKPRSTRMRRRPLPLLDQESSKPSEETLKEKGKEDQEDSLLPFKKRKYFYSTIITEKEDEDKKRKSDDIIIDEKEEEDNKKRRMNAFIPRYRTFREPQPEDLPIEFKRRIRKAGGDDFKFIIQKEITPSDVKKNNNRLSIPVRRVGSPEFLWDEEREKVKEREGTKIKGLRVTLMVELDDHDHDHRDHDQQSQRLILKEYDNILLKEWEMGKNKLYNLLSEWNKFVEDNKIAQHDVVQLWSFRKRSRLCFALVKVDPALISSSLIIRE
ncbi:B3 domain-containing protein [Trema orientale]|uniref:B3 domain-containing protein n=1 Tax=Trema orientale TaxID=63057 RepID=A0A2P5FTJ7_TREOI|nr:B3 domain-containing protein [Trema orientale]